MRNWLMFLGVLLGWHQIASAAPPTISVNGTQLRRCGDGVGYCGRIDRALDPKGLVAGRISIAYRWYPRSGGGPARGTLVTVEGGPGYGSIGTAGEFLAMTAALRDHRDLLIIDNRGTGHSGALDCQPLQSSRAQQQADVDRCAKQFAATGHLYGTRLAVDDLIAILDLLGVGKVDLYGDSYGTFFGQVFAAIAPQRLQSLVLDGAYPVRGGSPWFPERSDAIRRTAATVCRLSPACAGHSDPFAKRFAALLAQVRQNPPSGTVTNSNGTLVSVTATAAQLYFVMANGGGGNTVFRDIDAAGRALLDASDAVPLLRLVAEAQITGDGTSASTNPAYYSKALFAAVSCSDYDQVYDLRADFPARLAQLDAAIAARIAQQPDTWAPFTFDEVRASPAQEDKIDLCRRWRWPASAPTPGEPIAATATLTRAPTLILSGDLDVVTTSAESRAVAAQFANATFVRLANSFHVNALGDVNNCASLIYRHFVQTLGPGPTACAVAIAPVRTVARFAVRAAVLDPAWGVATDPLRLRIATALIQTAGDATARSAVNYSGMANGLRGGQYRYDYPSDRITVVTLDDAKWTQDVAVSGTLRWDQGARTVTGNLSAQTPLGRAVVRISWNEGGVFPLARIDGTLGGVPLHAVSPAP